jgi:multiple sugar transport system substrate-binding protein
VTERSGYQAQAAVRQAVSDLMSGRLSRRDFVRRAAILGLSGASISAILAACGGQAPAASSSSAPSVGASAGAATPAASAGAEGYDPMRYAGETVRIALVDGERDDLGLRDKIPEIKERMGLDVELTTMALGALLESNNQNLRAPESAFDVLHVLGFSVAGTVGAGLFHELTDWVADPDRTPADYDLADFPAGQLEYTGYFDVEAGTYGGEDLYLIPGIHSGSCILFYRKDLLEAAGVGVPTTWEDYLAAAQALNKDGVAGNCMIGANDVSLFLVDWYTRFITMGGQLTTGDRASKTLNTQFTSPEAVRATQHMIDCVQYAPAAVTSYGFTEALDAFATGKVAMMVFWSTIGGSLYNTESSTVADTTGDAVVPADEGQTPQAIRGGWGLGIPNNLPEHNKDVAWHFLTYLTSKEFEQYQVSAYQTDPNRTSTFTQPELVAELPHLPNAGKAADTARILEIAHLPEVFEIVGAAAREFNLALTGSQDAATACQKVQTEAEQILRTGGHLA